MNIVVIDTNVFVRMTHLCRKKQGPALVGLLRATGGKLYLPEILRIEYHEQTQAAVIEHSAELQKHESALKSLIGIEESVPPSALAVRQLVDERMDQLTSIVLEGPSNDALSAATTRRTVGKRPPGTKTDHGFKDCLIWESILLIEKGTTVWLATNDHGFFDGKSDELHPTLRDEAAALGIDVRIVRTLDPIVEAIAKEFEGIDLAELEARELQEQANLIVNRAVPAAPVSAAASEVCEDIEAVHAALAESEGRFEGVDLKVLGFVAYLDTVSKPELLVALAEAGIPAEVAANVVGRLVVSGLVRDSGTHYLIGNRSIQEAAAAVVEKEMIALLAKRRGRDE